MNRLELVQESLAESKTAHFSPFFTFFQLRSTGYAPSKTQKLTKNQPVFANGERFLNKLLISFNGLSASHTDEPLSSSPSRRKAL
jgi:hypothetical protein